METNLITKNAFSGNIQAGIPDENDLNLIARFTRNPPEKDNIYTFSVTLCDNDIDRDNERFSVNTLNTLCDMFTGVTGIFDHSMKSTDQTARIYRTQVCTDDSRTTATGESYVYLKAWCYMLRTEKNKTLIDEIDGGIKKEVSISCSCRTRICSVCGKDMRRNDCHHIQGEVYDGKICHAVLEDPTDAYEWSFVAVPAQRNAGVSKSMKKKGAKVFTCTSADPEEVIKSATETGGSVTLTHDQLKAFGNYLNSLKSDADTGRSTRENAEKEIISLSAFTLPDADTVMLKGILGKLSGDEVLMLRKALGDRADKLAVYTEVLSSEKKKSFLDNSQFRI